MTFERNPGPPPEPGPTPVLGATAPAAGPTPVQIRPMFPTPPADRPGA